MQVCQWINQQLEKSIEIYGIVTNGEDWKFYKLTRFHEVHETLLYGIAEQSILLGALRSSLQHCEGNVL